MSHININYSSGGIARWLDGFRDKWDDFYPSERWAFDKIASLNNTFGKVLDVGCGMGGLGLALSIRHALKGYQGIDINAQVIAGAQKNKGRFKIPVKFQCGDILKIRGLKKGAYDTVFSLSCADWNIETKAIIGRCWQYVKPGGFFVISLRLSDGPGINNIKKSFQPIAWDARGKPAEVANYVVFNAREFFRMIEAFKPRASHVYGYGYWGPPSRTAVTPYKKLAFSVLIIQKAAPGAKEAISAQLNFPLDLITEAAYD
ncbi:MAG: class I SAM-dependent methyltransferase [Candidatus Omnitrophica bacterium]|nr:class I SAM-dependent methyltransferase [Candidatus Omnitrophota bacterium]